MKNFAFILICSFMIYGCANRLPLTGGPEDKTPPEILKHEPKNLTTNFSEEEISIEFSKYMNKMQVEENVFFSPSVEYEIDWSGKEMQIEFNEELKENTTYALMIGTDYTDIRNNKPTQSFNLVFSTGNVIDTGKIAGKLYDEDPSGSFIYCFKTDEMNTDTFSISGKTPQYRSQIGTSGDFAIPALKDGKYRLFSTRDKYGNDIYDSGVDPFGAPFQDFVVENGIADFAHIKIGPPLDKTGPVLFGCFAKTSKIIALNLSEPIDTNSLNTESILLRDSANKELIDIRAVYISPGSANMIEVVLENEADTNSVWETIISADTGSILTDTLSNPIQDTANKVFFLPYPESDNLIPAMINPPFEDSTLKIPPNANFSFVFNTAIPGSISSEIELIKMSDPANIEIKKEIIGNILKIMPAKQLDSDIWYKISLDLKDIIALNDMEFRDTTINLRFKTADIRSYGTVSGRIKNPFCDSSYIIKLKSKISEKNIFTTTADKNGEWHFPQVPPEKFTLEIFCDMDGNGIYSYGNDEPFEFSEPFYIIEREINVQPRWDVEDVILTLPDEDR